MRIYTPITQPTNVLVYELRFGKLELHNKKRIPKFLESFICCGGDDPVQMDGKPATFPSLLTGRSNQMFDIVFLLSTLNLVFSFYSVRSIGVFFFIDKLPWPTTFCIT